MSGDDLLSSREVAELCGVAHCTADSWVQSGKLPVACRVKTGPRKVELRFRRADVEAAKEYLLSTRRNRLKGPHGQYYNPPPDETPKSVVVSGIRFPAWVGPELERRRAMLARVRSRRTSDTGRD